MSDRTDEAPGQIAEDPAGEAPAERRGGFRLWMLVPALGAAAVLAVFLLGLQRPDVNVLPSPLIDRPVPDFTLPPLREGQPGLSKADLDAPGVKLVNVWASWCGPCRVEHDQLMELEGRGLTLHGINYKDEPANAAGFLDELGDPFALVGADTTGRTGIEFGVYGVPETFVVDGSGTIVYKHVGPIMPKDVERYIMPAVEKARAGG